MSNNKKLLSVILALILALSVIPTATLSVSAGMDWGEDPEEYNGFQYVLDSVWGQETYTVRIKGYIGDDTDIVIPDRIGEYYVTSIDSYAFSFSNIKSVTLPDHLETIEQRAFINCTELTEITISDSVTYICDNAFEGCEGLTKITIPDSVTCINSDAFKNCTGLTEITIPASVNDIGYRLFSGCSNLQSVTVDENNPTYDSRDNCNAIIRTEDNTLVVGCAHSTIPDTVTAIGRSAFMDCTDLTKIEIPNSVTEIDGEAFYGCTGLKSVSLPDSVTNFSYDAFANCTSLTEFTIPDSVTSIGSGSFENCTGLAKITIPDTITFIAPKAFANCTSLTDVTIPDSVTFIGERTFYGCTSLTSMTIPASVTEFDDYALGLSDSGVIDGFRIYGYEGTAAENYAKDNHLTFIKLTDHQDEASGVSASVTDGVELRVADVLDQLPANTIKAYDISLLKNGKAVQPEHVVTVKIPCDDPDAKVYRKEADGSLTDMNAVYQDGYLSFKTTHFSVYIVATGAEVDPAICGDADGDGEVTVNDATFIQRYLVGSEISIDPVVIERNCDVDGDGKVNVIDVTLIQRKLAGLPVRYPIGEAL